MKKMISFIVTLLLLTSCNNQQDNNQNINTHLDDETFELTSDHSIFELVNTDDISVIEFIEDNNYLYAMYARPIFEASQKYETIIDIYDK